MNNKAVSKLLVIASIALSFSGIIFLIISIMKESKDTTYLCLALGSIILANLFNIIRNQYNKEK